MQKSVTGNKGAKHQIRVMEKLLAHTRQPSLKSIIDNAIKAGITINLGQKHKYNQAELFKFLSDTDVNL